MGTLKVGCFILEFLNICGCIAYFNYIFFHLRTEFGFGNKENLAFAALNGFLYIFASWFAGGFAQRRGYFTALYLGFGTLTVALGAGAFLTSLAGQIGVVALWSLGICFTWPVLEAMASDVGNDRAATARMVGIYNVVWASGAALAYFFGGAIIDTLGPRSLFWFPASLHAAQLVLALWLHRHAKTLLAPHRETPPAPTHHPEGSTTPRVAKGFLHLAWIANPFAYIAMNTLVPMIPQIAGQLNLTTAQAGFVASVWMFARLGAFVALWRWTDWHYRFAWLIVAYAAMVGSFGAILLVPNLAVMVLAQLIFGLAVGLIYYSSLFYSMDAGDAKGEHGGFHEALIGVGLFAGPALGAATLHVAPAHPQAGIWTVGALLLVGLGVLIRRRPAA
jgi:predicted MFS family arabinose efflux permease